MDLKAWEGREGTCSQTSCSVSWGQEKELTMPHRKRMARTRSTVRECPDEVRVMNCEKAWKKLM